MSHYNNKPVSPHVPGFSVILQHWGQILRLSSVLSVQTARQQSSQLKQRVVQVRNFHISQLVLNLIHDDEELYRTPP